MWRFLIVALVACSSAEAVTLRSSPSEWINLWVDARRCLVVPAEDLETGIAISLLEGRDCSQALRTLEREVPVVDDPLIGVWRSAISRLRRIDEPSAVRRSVEIQLVDAGARLLGALHGQMLPPMTRGPALPQATKHHVPDAEEWLRSYWWTTNMTMKSGPFRVAIGMSYPRPPRVAYEVALTKNDGATWRWLVARGQQISTRQYSSPPSIEQIVKRDDEYELDRFVPDGNLPITSTLPVPARATRLCHRDGVTWSIYDTTIHHHDGTGERNAGRAVVEGPLRCTSRGVVVDAPDQVFRCNHQICWREFVSPVPDIEGHASILDDGRWVFAVTLEHVATIWIEGLRPRYLRVGNVDWAEVFAGYQTLEVDGKPLVLASSTYSGR